FIPMARKYDLGTCMYNVLAGGLLTGKHLGHDAPVAGTRLAQDALYKERYWNPRQLDAARELDAIAKAPGRTLLELATRFVLDQAAVRVVLFGASRVEQLRSNLAVLDVPALSPDERERCDEIWRQVRGPVPRYHRDNATMGNNLSWT